MVLLVTVSVPPFSYSPPPVPKELQDGAVARDGTVQDRQCTAVYKDAAAALGGRIARKRAAGDRSRAAVCYRHRRRRRWLEVPVASLPERVLSVTVMVLADRRCCWQMPPPDCGRVGREGAVGERRACSDPR